MKVVVTGGSGLLGSHLKYYRPEWIYLSSKDCDLTDLVKTKYVFEYIKPDVVIHLAAKVGGIQFNIDHQPELLEENVLINTNVVKTAHNVGARIFAALSTCIYPNVADSYPMTEEMICAGTPPETNYGYAMSKRLMYDHIRLLNKKYNTKHCCFVPSNMYGCHKPDIFLDHAHFVPSLIKKIFELNNQNEHMTNKLLDIRLMGNGSPLRQFTYAGDVAKILEACVFAEKCPEIFNIATPQNLSIKMMAEIAVEELGHEDYEIVWDTSKPNGQFRKDVKNNNLIKYNGAEIDSMFTPFREGIKKVYDFASS